METRILFISIHNFCSLSVIPADTLEGLSSVGAGHSNVTTEIFLLVISSKLIDSL